MSLCELYNHATWEYVKARDDWIAAESGTHLKIALFYKLMSAMDKRDDYRKLMELDICVIEDE
jgi:hypothetical protein